MLFFYVRHGDPIYETDSLTPLGRRQAEAVAKRLSLHGLDKIYASTMRRANLTAEPTCEILKLDKTQVDFANEQKAWDLLSLDWEDGNRSWVFHEPKSRKMLHDPSVRALGSKWYTHPAFAEHTDFQKGIERVSTGTDDFFLQLGYKHIPGTGTYRAVAPTDERVALFAHQGVGLILLSHLLDIPFPLFATNFDMGHTGMTVIEFKQEPGSDLVIPCVLTLGSDGHLYREGLPTKYQNVLYF